MSHRMNLNGSCDGDVGHSTFPVHVWRIHRRGVEFRAHPLAVPHEQDGVLAAAAIVLAESKPPSGDMQHVTAETAGRCNPKG
eukprot:6249256-Amphidinium_carterae.1